jgi:DNA/RNA endonuclease YhcR with UshA esterase domain
VRGIKDLHERSFTGSTAKISVDSKNSAQTISDELLQRDFGTFTVDVVSSTANTLELKVMPK